MSKFTGNIIRLPAITPSQSSASGVFTLDDQFTAQATGTWPILRDQYFNYTTLLLTGAVQGTTGPNPVTQPYSFLSDASTNNFVVSPNGDVSARAFNPYLNNYSNYFNGTSDYLSIADNAAFNFGTGDATVEFWFSSPGTTNNYPGIVSAVNYAATGVASIRFDNTGYKGKVFMYLNGGGDPVIASTSTVPYNVWTHVAIVRQGTSLKLYLNGSLDASVTISASLGWYLSNGGMRIGRGFDVDGAGGYYPGYLSNLRLVKGTAVYTAPFVPSTIPLQNITNTSLLTCQSNRFRDNSTANSGSGFTITPNGSPAVSQNSPFVSYDTTNGSGYFDGTGDYLTAPSNASFNFGTNDFTIECWIYQLSRTAAQYDVIWTLNGPGVTGTTPFRSGMYLSLGAAGGNFLVSNSSENGWSVNISVTLPTLFTWEHYAVTRSGNTWTVYKNGQSIGSANSSAGVINSRAPFSIGTQGTEGDNYFDGYISGFRVVKGAAVYTGAFAPPTGPLQTSGAASAASYPSTTNVNTSFAESATSLLTLQTRAPATNNGFVDSSPNNFVITRNGNTTQGTFTPFSPTGWGNRFDGTAGQYLNTPSNAAFALGTGNFTLEAWVYVTGTSWCEIFTTATGSFPTTAYRLLITNAQKLQYYDGTNAATSTASIALNTWTHVCVVREGTGTNQTKLYINGNQDGTTTSSNNLTNTTGYIGRTWDGIIFTGYISNLRLVKGQALYTGNFTPATSALTATSVGATGTNVATSITGAVSLLTCQSNRFRDASANNFTITTSGSPSVQAFSPFAPASSYIPSLYGGSGYFDGTGSGTAADYLTVPDSPVFTLGSGDFTLETWVYSTLGSGADRYYIAHTDNATAAASQFAFYQRSADAFILFEYYVGATSSSITSGAAITLNQWNHIAVCRSNGTLSMFVNGVRPASGTTNISTTAFNDSASNLSIGGRTSGAALLTGNISGMRLVRGTDLYGASNTTITVPTAPPTPVTGTSLLLNFTNGGIVDATGKNNLETVGNSGVQTTVIKYGNGSMYFDGTVDCLFEPSSTNYGYGTGDFTIEFWLRLNNTGTQTIVSNLTTSSSTAPHIYYQISSNIRYFTNGADRITGNALNANQWYHIAVCRFNSNTRLFIDGSQAGSTYPDTNNYGTSNPLGVGDYGVPLSGVSTLNGYISNLRITKYARYTSNFNTNLPSGPFPIG